MQEVGELVSKSISTAMGATSLVLLFTPLFPAGISNGRSHAVGRAGALSVILGEHTLTIISEHRFCNLD